MLNIRKLVTVTEEISSDGGRPASGPCARWPRWR